MLSLLYRPLIYLQIKTKDKYKVKLDYYLPVIISVILSSILLWLYASQSVNIFAFDNKLISSISGFVQILPGFFIAALAAIATFPSTSMNDPMPGNSPYLSNSSLTDDGEDKLSRRRFLCYLFSYLTYISIIGFFLITIIVFLHSFSMGLPNIVVYVGYYLSCFISFFILIQITCLTFIGLWYLGERIHINDPR